MYINYQSTHVVQYFEYFSWIFFSPLCVFDDPRRCGSTAWTRTTTSPSATARRWSVPCSAAHWCAPIFKLRCKIEYRFNLIFAVRFLSNNKLAIKAIVLRIFEGFFSVNAFWGKSLQSRNKIIYHFCVVPTPENSTATSIYAWSSSN